jgi:GH3 auxin-responsive promoter
MSLTAAAATLVWAAASVPARERFRSALRDPRKAQHALLRRYLHQNRDTVFGTAHGFAEILDAGRASADDLVAAYQDRVPLTSYDDVEPLIARVAAGEAGVLTHARVDRLAPSSGSTSAAKLIPQTRDSSRELSRAVDAWIADLYWRRPGLMAGPSYWSITPATSFESVAAARFPAPPADLAVPVGFDNDSAYLGGMRRKLVDALLAVPPEVRLIADVGAFRYATLLFLVRAPSLRLMSVWHPSFLLQLIDGLQDSADRIVHDLSRGGIDPPAPVDPSVRRSLEQLLRAMPDRAAELRALRTWTPRAVWPELAVISCWGDGAAKAYAARLARAFPGVEVQRKGLIATEAIVSVPFGDAHPLAIRSHFLEFIDGDGRARLAHDLQHGEEYSVAVTTGSGLYRYRLGDRVRVDGRVAGTPSIEFVGRADRVSDRYGEKLSDGFVATVLAKLFTDAAPPRFAMVAPEVTAEGVAYTLLIEPEDSLPRDLEGALERGLRQNPHYAWCVDLGQLRPARVVRVGPHADRAFLDACVARGQRLGDVKPVALHQESGWIRALGAPL